MFKMKFVLDTVSKLSGRCGALSCFDKYPNKSLQTPLLLIYTRGASVPNLSREVFDYLTTEFQSILISVQGTEQMQEAVKHFGKGIQSYSGLEHCLSFLTLKDAAEPCPTGQHANDSIPIFTRHGKVKVTPERFMDIVESFQPDIYQMLGDGDTNVDSSKKRLNSSVEKTEQFFIACMERRKKSEALKNSILLATVSGGYNLLWREKSAKFYKEYDQEVDGYVIDGLHCNGVEASMLNRASLQEVVGHTLNFLPSEKMRAMLGAYNPLTVLEMVKLGVDVFDSSYVYLCSKQNRALTFSFDWTIALDDNSNYHLDASDVKYKEEFTPISSQCQCLTCQKHTRAYLYHLIDCNELLSQILLTIHNMHHYMEFFKAIRASITNDSLPQLIDHIERQMCDDKLIALALPQPKVHPLKSDREKKKSKLRLDKVNDNVANVI